ncbi:MAG: ABC transporter permease, partial [Bacteroidota bacterium]
MIRLLQIEFIKLWNNKSSRFLILAYFGLMTFIAFVSSLKIDYGPLKFNVADIGLFNFPYI